MIVSDSSILKSGKKSLENIADVNSSTSRQRVIAHHLVPTISALSAMRRCGHLSLQD
jgi:hypothetical protein